MLTGGDGSDVFVYNIGDGNDIITDYTEEDIINVNGKVDKIAKSGKNVIITVGSNKISVMGGADKVISYTDNNGSYTYPQVVNFSANGKGATILSAYSKTNFDINDYDEYADSVITINASAVAHELEITANGNANRIIGSDENDYVDGGKVMIRSKVVTARILSSTPPATAMTSSLTTRTTTKLKLMASSATFVFQILLGIFWDTQMLLSLSATTKSQ